jgi:hypothetical protein
LSPATAWGPGPGAADRPGHPDFLEDRDELRAVCGLADGQDEDQSAALAVGGDMDLAGLPAPRASEQSCFQAGLVPAPDTSPFLPLGIG